MRNRIIVVCIALVLTGVWGPSASAGVILPPDGAALNYTHVPFRWEPLGFSFLPGGGAAYQLQVVEDNGMADPFAGQPSAVFLANVDAHEPRIVVRQGLEFGKSYAWRVRGFEYDPTPWSATYRFSIPALPAYVPTFSVTETGAPIQPGITMLTIFSQAGQIPGGQALFVAVDEDGKVIWHLTTGSVFGNDLRLLENGRILYISSNRGTEGTLAGGIAWQSPADPNQQVHHEIFPMPNGDKLAVLYEFRDVMVGGMPQSWRGDRIVVYDRHTSDIVWSWSTFDYLSTLDFDATTMTAPDPQGKYRWTWTNAGIYNELDNSVYISCRHLNRVVRIDYDTGEIVYNMGFDAASGEVDFGDNLFSFQHGLEALPNGNLLVYDNGNRRNHMDQTSATGMTKVIELAFGGGEPPSGASIVWQYTLPSYNNFVGSNHRQPNGNTVITAGAAAQVIEVDATGTEVWRLSRVGGGVPNYGIYRSTRDASLIVDTPGDTDGDWDLDSRDFGQWQVCYTGSGPADLDFPCTLCDVDGDDDVDAEDWSRFEDESTGPL
ncbi:MAG: hypothetical protein HOP29_04360 [Phycisphaerales bacterium]|nr:hypothetical protein [Phycisphaerales bacterium]